MHSCLSPCGDLLMSPATIAKTLKEKGVKLAALTDHNSALNCPAFAKCCRDEGIAVLYGMEAQSAEELHVLTLFSDLPTAADFCAEWYETLPNIINNPEKTGDQVYVDENDEIVGEVEKYLITSSSYTLDETAAKVHALGGLVIPAHVDRPAFSMMSQLGAIVEGDWDALEFVRPQDMKFVTADSSTDIVLPRPYPVTTSSDAHYVEHIARRAFDLDIGDLPLQNADGSVNLAAVNSGLATRMKA
jgi:3',5'-nucleoside bisphosphate phosphatase